MSLLDNRYACALKPWRNVTTYQAGEASWRTSLAQWLTHRRVGDFTGITDSGPTAIDDLSSG